MALGENKNRDTLEVFNDLYKVKNISYVDKNNQAKQNTYRVMFGLTDKTRPPEYVKKDDMTEIKNNTSVLNSLNQTNKLRSTMERLKNDKRK
ncbi:MAG: hypothetical protein Q4G04_05680 [bacterium]|nr:hypothetical protein [bacterium]